MDIIATMIGFLSPGIDIASEVILVWGLVFRKPRIPVNAVGTVLGLYAADTFIKQGDAGDDDCQQVFKLITGRFVFIPMGIEPFTIVVCRQLF